MLQGTGGNPSYWILSVLFPERCEMKKKQSQFIGYEDEKGSNLGGREGEVQELREKTGYKGKLKPRYSRLVRRR